MPMTVAETGCHDVGLDFLEFGHTRVNLMRYGIPQVLLQQFGIQERLNTV